MLGETWCWGERRKAGCLGPCRGDGELGALGRLSMSTQESKQKAKLGGRAGERSVAMEHKYSLVGFSPFIKHWLA